jgi:hypothetical protein
MFEKSRKGDLVWMALGFIVAGCLTAWVTALSIERLIHADWDGVPADKPAVQITQAGPKAPGN